MKTPWDNLEDLALCLGNSDKWFAPLLSAAEVGRQIESENARLLAALDKAAEIANEHAIDEAAAVDAVYEIMKLKRSSTSNE